MSGAAFLQPGHDLRYRCTIALPVTDSRGCDMATGQGERAWTSIVVQRCWQKAGGTDGPRGGKHPGQDIVGRGKVVIVQTKREMGEMKRGEKKTAHGRKSDCRTVGQLICVIPGSFLDLSTGQ